MPHATNPVDGIRVYFEDEGGGGDPVVLTGGLLDSVADVRESELAGALPGGEFRLIYADHRGLGRSDKPTDPASYAMELRAGDVVAILDELGVERAHYIGKSWGGRLGFGLGEHAAMRLRSLSMGGNQPYEWPDGPLVRTVSDGLARAQKEGMEGLVGAFERFWGVRFPEPTRGRWLDNDPAALAAAWKAALAEGAVSGNLGAWQLPCLIFIGAADADFLDQARQAAEEIPRCELLVLEEADHYAAHVGGDEPLRQALLRTLRAADAP